MQIKIDLKILVFILIFYLTHQLRIYSILMAFTLIHELSHIMMGFFLGIKPITIEVKPIGFSAEMNNLISDFNKKVLHSNMLELKKIFVYIVGPITNIVIAIVVYFSNLNYLVKEEIIYINLIIAFINILPIYPLDGGRILKSAVSIFCGLQKSYELTEKISLFVTVIMLTLGSIVVLKVQNYGLLMMLIYLLYINISENRKLQKKIELYRLINKGQ